MIVAVILTALPGTMVRNPRSKSEAIVDLTTTSETTQHQNPKTPTQHTAQTQTSCLEVTSDNFFCLGARNDLWVGRRPSKQ